MRDLERLADVHFQHCRCQRKQHRFELMEWYAQVAVALEHGLVTYTCPICQQPTSEPIVDFAYHETSSGIACRRCLAESVIPVPAAD